jgi:citrate/tricarballylate utilization protein
MRATEATADARRFMEICNACRYCEGYCAVFPAMELRREFSDADLSYLANLCHNCRGCFYACQYAPPHEFGINLPRSFAEIRAQSYEEYAWPKPLAGLFRRNGLVVSLIAALAIALTLILTILAQSPDVLYGAHAGAGSFYAVIPYGVMVTIGTITFVYALVALAMGFVNFWRDTASGARVGPIAMGQALWDIFTLRNLGGGGHGCNDKDESFAQSRRWLHHAMFYGFLACFAATSVATVYHHWFGWVAPYPFLSWPVLLGTLGGIGLMIGTTGLFWMKLTADQEPAARELLGADTALLILLDLAAFTGLLLLVLRDSGAMGIVLALHLGVILALFLVLPYGKFVHGVYRSAALLLNAVERRSKEPVHAGG